MSEIGREIRRMREGKGWSQAELAVYAGSSQPTVNQIESGKRNPSTATLVKLAGALDVEVADLFPKAQTPLQLEFTKQAGQHSQGVGAETLYTEFEAFGRVLASSWKAELEEWNKKIPTGTSPSLFEFGRLIEWSVGIAGTRHVYESMARDDGRPLRGELEDTLKLMKELDRESLEKVQTAFEPAKTYAEFQKIVKANDLEAILSSAEIDG